MMGREWKPGDVAMVNDPVHGERVALFVTDGDVCCWHVPLDDDLRCLSSDAAEGARPLAVIDPEDRAQVERLADAWLNAAVAEGGPERSWYDEGAARRKTRAALREFAAPTPPKPDEPTGLGAVVRDDGTRWTLAVRIPGSFPWVGEHGGVRGWNEFSDAVEVLSEGVIA